MYFTRWIQPVRNFELVAHGSRHQDQAMRGLLCLVMQESKARFQRPTPRFISQEVGLIDDEQAEAP